MPPRRIAARGTRNKASMHAYILVYTARIEILWAYITGGIKIARERTPIKTTCSSQRKFKIFADFHIFSRESEVGVPVSQKFWDQESGVARKISRLYIPDLNRRQFHRNETFPLSRELGILKQIFTTHDSVVRTSKNRLACDSTSLPIPMRKYQRGWDSCLF